MNKPLDLSQPSESPPPSADPQRWVLEAQKAMQRGELDEAIRLLTRAISARPLASTYHLLIECYLLANELSEAQTLVDLIRTRAVPYEYTLSPPDGTGGAAA